jgi:pyruvate dehydrogenase E2 component (dihydrolipoamide acetyltransferase)
VTVKDVQIPDIGDFKDVDVIDVLIAEGDTVKVEDSLITLESDKASMDVPSPYAGTIKTVEIKTGDKVSEGSKILTMEVEEAPPAEQEQKEPEKKEDEEKPRSEAAEAPPEPIKTAPEKPTPPEKPRTEETTTTPVDEQAFEKAHAGPGVRRYARELGVDLGQVSGSGRKGRIIAEDVHAFVKKRLAKPQAVGLPPMPEVDFSKYGEIESRPLSRIQKISAGNLQRNWTGIPHVTQFDEADITSLENFRKQQSTIAEKQQVRLTLLPFLMKACAAALKTFPDINASLDSDGETLILKKYLHLGIAVDTDEGLLVPVVRDVDRKGVFDLARELMQLSDKARNKHLTPEEMQGGCFTISNLGGIGGTAFTPIINAPEPAILGVSRSVMKPVYNDGDFQPRLMLPLSFSYDHRVIDGAKAARFVVHLSGLLRDIRTALL